MAATRKMVVEGYTVPDDVLRRAVAWCHERSGFTAGQLQAYLLEIGVPREPVQSDTKVGLYRDKAGPSHRLTDRILQRERRAGTIEFRRSMWYRTGLAGRE